MTSDEQLINSVVEKAIEKIINKTIDEKTVNMIVENTVLKNSNSVRTDVDNCISNAEARITKGMSLYLGPMNDKLAEISATQKSQDEAINKLKDRVLVVENAQKATNAFIARVIMGAAFVVGLVQWCISTFIFKR